MEWMNLLFRWLHIIAGVMWIGHLYFFNFVNAQVAKTYDADSKKKVIPELMPRALYWFRWGAAYTWVTGFLLLGIIYYAGGTTLTGDPPKIAPGPGSGIGFGSLIVGFGLYDILWKRLASKEMVGVVVSFVLAIGLAFGLAQFFSDRALFIHMGAILGTIMAANVWMRIWPNQRRIITAIKEGRAPEPAWAAMAGLRSKHNTYMSIPLLFFMLTQHATPMFGYSSAVSVAVVAGIILVGWLIARLCFAKSASEAPKQV